MYTKFGDCITKRMIISVICWTKSEKSRKETKLCFLWEHLMELLAHLAKIEEHTDSAEG